MATRDEILDYFKKHITEENYKDYLQLLNFKVSDYNDANNEIQKTYINIIDAMYKGVLDINGVLNIVNAASNLNEINTKLDALNPDGKLYSEFDLSNNDKECIATFKVNASNKNTPTVLRPIIKNIKIDATEAYGYTSLTDYEAKYCSSVDAGKVGSALPDDITGDVGTVVNYLKNELSNINWYDMFIRKNNLSCFADTRPALIQNIVNFEINGIKSTEIGNALAAKLSTGKTLTNIKDEILGYYSISDPNNINRVYADSLIYNINILYIIDSSNNAWKDVFEAIRDNFRTIIQRENEKIIYNN